ncbi:MAG TPA: isochorismatase family protein, partial [Polyangiaceae bacterium]|nr:isochorismatase family protein [Polyangiaceae bacterium]
PPRFRFVPNVLEAKIEPFVDELASRRCHALYFEKEVYSMFANPLAERVLAALVRRLEADPRFVVYGVATDYCVAAAVLGLRERGYRTALVTDAITGIDEAGSARSLEQMRGAGADLIRLSDLL